MQYSDNTENKANGQVTKTGWTQQESSRLFSEAQEAIMRGDALKDVFLSFAKRTGRKPNSIRNYYYNSLKNENAGLRTNAFVQFTEREVWELMVSVLGAQAQGISVRSCAMSMGGGVRKDMLRFQNKYRSVIKNNPEYVQKVMAHMKENGMPCFDPYAEDAIDGRRGNSGRKPNARKRQSDMIDIISGIMDDLRMLNDVDMSAFLKGLHNLTSVAAGKNAHADSPAEVIMLREREEALKSRIAGYEELINENNNQITSQNKRLDYQNEAIGSLLSMLRQIIKVNRDFLGQNSVIKVSNLSSYINELARSIESCERSIKNFAG